jgi:hypothetical protein
MTVISELGSKVQGSQILGLSELHSIERGREGERERGRGREREYCELYTEHRRRME